MGYVHAVAAMVQHLNVATPRWLSLFFQRPEAHGLHHERGVHYRNFADLPLWDRVFGTYANPHASTATRASTGQDRKRRRHAGFADVHGGRL